MKRRLLLFLLILALSGCIRTYRMEHSSHVDSRLHFDGSASTSHHQQGGEREWLGFWPLPPSCIQP